MLEIVKYLTNDEYFLITLAMTTIIGYELSEEENAKIVAFMKTLTGDQPQFLMPILPPSVDATPKPQPFD